MVSASMEYMNIKELSSRPRYDGDYSNPNNEGELLFESHQVCREEASKYDPNPQLEDGISLTGTILL